MQIPSKLNVGIIMFTDLLLKPERGVGLMVHSMRLIYVRDGFDVLSMLCAHTLRQRSGAASHSVVFNGLDTMAILGYPCSCPDNPLRRTFTSHVFFSVWHGGGREGAAEDSAPSLKTSKKNQALGLQVHK